MSILLRKKYDSIKKDKLSDTAKKVLKSMYDATNGFKDATASRKIKSKFDDFYTKLEKSKPEAIKGASKPKETPSSKQFKEARERRKSQAGVPKSESDIKKDANRPAIDRKGKRVTDGTHYPYKKGNTYYEYRDNRYDKRPSKYPKLEDGGMMADGGEVDNYVEVNGTFYKKGTPQGVINALENARNNRTRVKIFYGDPETGRDWHEEHDTTGTIGRSTGSIKIPLLIPTSRSSGGGSILTKNIVKIRDTKSGRVLYQNENYKQPNIEIVESTIDGYTHELIIDGELYSRHKSKRSAEMLKSKMMADGGMMEQGYDDREDERLSMEHGKMSMKDLDSTHARRDDARFEERMAHGGMMAKGGNLDAKYTPDDVYQFAVESKYIIGFQAREDILYFKTKEEAKNYVKERPSNRTYLGIIMAEGSMMAKGGETKKAKEVWGKMSIKDRMDFLKDEYKDKIKGDNLLAKRLQDESKLDWDDLAIKIQMELEKKISKNEMAHDGMMAKGGEVGDYFYDSRKDKPFVVIFEDGKNMGIQYLSKDKKEIGGVEKILKDTFEYNVSNGSWGKWKQAFEHGGMMAKGGKTKDDNDITLHLYYHKTSGGAEYLGNVPVTGSKEASFQSEYVIRMDGAKTHGGEFRLPSGKMIKLYYHETNGGAKYLCSNKVKGTKDEGSFQSKYIVRIDGANKGHGELFIRDYKKHEDGGMMEQGYDDREDERLSMEHGKMSMKDLHSTHARRDDARFEERGKMAEGGMMAKGGEIVVKNPRFPYTEGYFKTTKEANEFILRQSKYRNVSGWNIEEVKKSSNKPKVEQGGMMADGGEVNKFDYMMLDRLRSDNEYYLGNGNRNPKNLWAGSVDGQIEEMKKLWNQLPKDGKPEWLSMEDIEEYEKKMKGHKMADGGETHRLHQVFEGGGEIEESNLEMVQSNVKAIEHHASELKNLLQEGTPIEAWVVAKLERAETDLSDVTHYIDGLKGEEVESDTYFANGGMMAKGGKLSVKEYKLVPMVPYGVKGYLQADYKNTIRFEGTEEEAVAKAKELANSNPTFVQVEIKVEMKTKVITIGIVEGSNKEYADGGMMAKGGEVKNKMFTIYFSDYIPYKSSKYYNKSSILKLAEDKGVKITNYIEKNVNNNIEFLVSGTKSNLLKFMQTCFDDKNYSIDDLDNAIEMYEENTMADGGMMAKGGNIDYSMSNGLRKYYMDTFPNDELGKEINPKATFRGLYKALEDHIDVYEYIGVGDSIVRERLFSKLAEVKGVNYNVIYDMWMGYAKGGQTKKPRTKRTSTLEKLKKGGKLVGNQKKLDVNKNGKLDAQDFKKLREQRKAKK